MPRGGARPGAGAKPREISDKLKKALLKAVEKVAKRKKINPHDVLAEILIKGTFKGKKVEVKDWIVSYKIYLDAFVIKSTHKQIDEHHYDHRVVILPSIKRPKEDEIPQA